MEKIILNEQIASLRKSRGITQEALAKALGVTNQAVSKWESGQCCPDITLLPDIARYFGTSIDMLMGCERKNIETVENTYRSPTDPRISEAKMLAAEAQYISVSVLQRRMRIGYGRAQGLIKAMAGEGYIVKKNDFRYELSDAAKPCHTCGIYRSDTSELVETERFALVYYCTEDKSLLGTKLYALHDGEKSLVAVCERDQTEKFTGYAYLTTDGKVRKNSDGLSAMLGERYDDTITANMHQREHFSVDHSEPLMPTVAGAGIKQCLKRWRKAARYSADYSAMRFLLCTDKTEYVFSIDVRDTNIYCGISANKPFDGGLFGGNQFFRIRNYADNTQPFCGAYCDFSFDSFDASVPTERFNFGKTVNVDGGILFCVKHFSNDEIVLQGCGGDEYRYSRHDRRDEIFI